MEHQVREGVWCYRDLRQVISVWQKYKRRELECIWNAITDEQLILLRDRGDVVSPKVFRLNLWTFWCILFSLRKYIKMKQLHWNKLWKDNLSEEPDFNRNLVPFVCLEFSLSSNGFWHGVNRISVLSIKFFQGA